MKRIILLLTVIGLISSCTLGSLSDEENINQLIAGFENVLIAGFSFSQTDSVIKGPINTLGWYRERAQDGTSFTTEITIDNDYAFVEIHVLLDGSLNIKYLTDSLDTAYLFKEFEDTLIRYAEFRKDTSRNYFGGWRLDNITCGHIDAELSDSALLSIDSVRLYADDIIDTVISNIEALFPRGDIIELPGGQTINIDVYVPNTDNVFYVHSDGKRARFAVSDSIYTGSWTVPLKGGYYRCIIDGMHYGTILNDSTPYDCSAWFLPYKSI